MRRVRATATGHYDGRIREPGDEFLIADNILPGSWFTVLDETMPAPAEPVKKAPPRRPTKQAAPVVEDHSDLL